MTPKQKSDKAYESTDKAKIRTKKYKEKIVQIDVREELAADLDNIKPQLGVNSRPAAIRELIRFYKKG
jgi:hypothetical protein